MIAPKIMKLLKGKYVGSRLIITKDNNCLDNKVTMQVQVDEEYLNQTDTIQEEIKSITKITFEKIIPVIER